MKNFLPLLFLVLSFLSAVAPMVAALVFLLIGNNDAALGWFIGSIAGVLPCWLFMKLSFLFSFYYIGSPRHTVKK